LKEAFSENAVKFLTAGHLATALPKTAMGLMSKDRRNSCIV